MEFEEEIFYKKLNNHLILKKNYIVHYSFHPGLHDKICSINLIINNNYNYQLFLFFYETNMPEKEVFKSPTEFRTFLSQSSRLPFKIKKECKSIFENELFLKKNYYNDKNVFGILDRNEKYIVLNHKTAYYKIDLTCDTLNENLFEQKEELEFLKFSKNLENWVNELRDDLMKPYQK